MFLLGAVAVSALVQLGIHHIPATQALFQISSLSMADCALSVGMGLIPLIIVELGKILFRRFDSGSGLMGSWSRV